MNDDLAIAAITDYLDRQHRAAREALDKAKADHDQAVIELLAWNDRHEPPSKMAGSVDLAAYAIVGYADGEKLTAMRTAIEHRTPENLAAVDDAKERAAAVRAWFRAKGINWGEDESAVTKKRR